MAELEQAHQLKFDVLMMDIEGGELDFLRENQEKLKELQAIFMEVHEHKDVLSKAEVEECLTIVQSAGFEKVVDDTSFWVLIKKS